MNRDDIEEILFWLFMITVSAIILAIAVVLSKNYKIINQETVGSIEYNVVDTYKNMYADTTLITNGEIAVTLDSTTIEYTTLLKSNDSKQYKVISKKLYNYCEENSNVVIEFKEYQGNIYRCFEGEVLKFVRVD